MKIIKKTVILLIPLLFLSIITKANQIKEVTVAWENDLKPPYIFFDSNKKLTGISYDIISRILLDQDIKFKNIILPWKRCLWSLKNKKVDMVPNASYKRARAKYAFYTEPLYTTHLILLYNKAKFKTPPKISSIKDLKKYTIGGILGFNYNYFKNLIKLDTGSKSRKSLVAKVHLGRIDFGIIQEEVLLMLNKQKTISLKGLGMVKNFIKPIKVYDVLTIKTLKGKKLQHIIDDGIGKLRKDGTLHEIYKKYLGNINKLN